MNLLLRSLAGDLRASNIRSQVTSDGNTMVVKYPIIASGNQKYLNVQIMADPQRNGKLIYLVYDITDRKMPNSSAIERQMVNFNRENHPYKLVVDKERYFVILFEQYISGVSDTEIEMHCVKDVLEGFTNLMTFVKLHYREIRSITNS